MFEVLSVMNNSDLMQWIEKAGKEAGSFTDGRMAETVIASYRVGKAIYDIHAGLGLSDRASGTAGQKVLVWADLIKRGAELSVIYRSRTVDAGNGNGRAATEIYDIIQNFVQDAADTLSGMA